MRLNIEIELKKPKLPKDYRRGFMSLIKAAFESGDDFFYRQLYDKKADKPFTFSVYFPELKGEEDGFIHVGNNALLNVSSNEPVLMTHLYNGTRKITTHQWQDYNSFKIKSYKAFFNKEIRKDHCLFRTVAPFLVNKEGENLQYLTPENNDFDKGFRHNIQELARKFLNKDHVELEYTIHRHKKMVVSHYNQSMTCNKGIIEMHTEPKILNLLNNIGIGVRRSQGFGMVETIKR
jgi:CRISPR-associated endoribonuclease Cas6